MKKIEVKKMIFLEGDTFEGISFVEDPASDRIFVAMSKEEKPQEQVVDMEKGTVTGVVLVPEQLIYRYINGKEFFMQFSKDTIYNMAMAYMKNGYNYFTVEHNYESYGNHTFESWIKDSEEDKSNALGFNEPIGTWFITVKVNDNDLLQKIKSGEVKGFSIEAILSAITIDASKTDSEEDDVTLLLNELYKLTD